MEKGEKVKLAFSITVATCVTALISIYLTKLFHHKKSKCYLDKERSKPQHKFKSVFADNSYSQFKHLNLKTADEYLHVHPYKDHIELLLKQPKVEFFLNGEKLKLEELEEITHPFMWVETETQLKMLADVLCKETVFAVDTEQHGLRSFLGFTALIQISTKEEDFLVDSIALHDHMEILRPVFANPMITKVFHGADNDVLWLQRDFHIYIVNLFDTAKACDILSKPQRSLAYLLESYCGVSNNKLLQREDWRQRPLPADMLQYARTDAHYLLYIAQCLSSELKQRDSETPLHPDDEFHFLLEASRRSNSTCLQLFSKELEAYPGESAASSIVSRHVNDQDSLSSSDSEAHFQDFVSMLCAWRDIMARVHDESLRYVLSEQAIIAIATKGTATEIEIYNTISKADLNADSTSVYFIQTPSPVICSHLVDIEELLRGKTRKLDDIFQTIFERHLGSTRTCPITLFNYSLLSKGSLQLTSRPAPKLNGSKPGKQVGRKSSRQSFVEKFSCKAPVYHNCKIYANDGRLLCHCDLKKLEWEICEHDLEQALLVGMTPHERRRFMRKRGLLTNQISSKAENEASSITSENDTAVRIEKSVSSAQDVNINGTQLQSGGSAESALCGTKNDNYAVDLIPPNDVSEPFGSGNGILSNGTTNKNSSAKRNSKFSLLGHGPHGKQVVEYLLKEHGEDGIREFCQRWRQIFVASLNPRFLPAGWDVRHSGKRDFGEYSVYNPSNKVSSSMD